MRWKNLGLYPRFYNEKCSFNMKFNENENIIDFTCTHNVLEMGTLARFSHPDLRSPCRLQKANLPNLEDNHHFNSKLPVSRDENIMNLLQQFEVDIVISFSALKCITDSSDLKNKWLIPIVVKKIKIQRENEPERSKKIVFLDKRCSYTETSNVDFAHLSFKRLIRTNFCQFEAFKYDKQETSVSTSEETRNKSSTVNENADEAFREKNCNKIHHNATYRIWNIKKTDCQNNLMKNKSKSLEINVLVRSKLDACECNENNTLQPVILYPKLEMQLNFGANIPSKSELAREWTSLFFTPYSNLYRVRISPLTNEVICVERCTIQKVVTEAQTHYNYKPHLGLGILQKVFEKLQMLEPGNYLLQHLPKHEAFVAVLKECQESGGDRFDLHSEQEKIVTDSLPKDWLPIDVNFVLPSFDIARRMPGMFSPRKKFNKVKKKKKGKKLKSTKGKAKKSKQ
ncbi:uncharacterized protein LOC132703476 isoform X2 [Cylas formicarius]|nr:uncharacterized protein LOC132703476 isoform X2 [Cylas formicarius]XP_060528735.1 uncharacterized protein LOC132703476 isoform X2 [Cylas formicarius]XP_060528736.1 uncharacterized protein LOC132703476 isoform X2 [Cylas formicarius]